MFIGREAELKFLDVKTEYSFNYLIAKSMECKYWNGIKVRFMY